MKKKKITAIMAVIMMVAGLSACSQSNAGLEGKSGIVKDEDSKTESDTGVVDQTPATYVQDAEYVNKDDIVSVDDTIEINGITLIKLKSMSIPQSLETEIRILFWII